MIEMDLKRSYSIDKLLQKNKVTLLYGARQVGKTTLIKRFLKNTKLKFRLESGDDMEIQKQLSRQDFKVIKEFCQGVDLIVIDEAQNIPNIGMALKIMVDNVPDLHVLVTGSSSFDLAHKVGEPLVGRQRIFKLFPLAQQELIHHFNRLEIKRNLPDYLIFGSYPEVLTSSSNQVKIELLLTLVNSYLLKDILALEKVKSPALLHDLLQMLAYQIGSEVSLNELSSDLKVDVKTVGRYLDLLEKSFIIQSVGGFSRNLRNEITSKRKYYFIDNGVRNGLINNFNTVAHRNDIGALWENFLFMERLKKKTYERLFTNDYFWRTYSQKEIDLIEEREGKLFGFEFKWKPGKYKIPADWTENYPGSTVEIIDQENYLDFIL